MTDTLPEFIKVSAVKEYINSLDKMRAGQPAVDKLTNAINAAIVQVLQTAAKLAADKKRTTILEADIAAALEKNLGKRHLTWSEVSDEIILQTPADLGKISKAINDFIANDKK